MLKFEETKAVAGKVVKILTDERLNYGDAAQVLDMVNMYFANLREQSIRQVKLVPLSEIMARDE